MQAHATYGPRDDGPLTEGDFAFRGVNMQTNPGLLPSGFVSFARNLRFRSGHPTTRSGLLRMPWAASADTSPVWASASFRSPAGGAYLLKIRTTQAELCHPISGVFTIAYPGGVTIDSECDLVQTFDRVVLFRGTGHTPLVWVPPAPLSGPTAGTFAAITLSSGGDGTEPIPNAAFGLQFQNRLLVPFNRDEIAASDVLDYTRYDAVLQQFKINKGTEDSITGLLPAGRGSLLVFKDQSIHALENFTGDLSLVSQDELPVDHGLAARRSAVSYGRDILYLGSDRALYALSQALDNRLQASPEPISQPIEPLMRSIKTALLAQAISAVWGRRLYLAVALGAAATENNAVLVYDFITGAWDGVDTGPAHAIQNLIVHPYEGQMRLFMVQPTGDIYLYEEGHEDILPAGAQPIASELISRGYRCQTAEQKTYLRAEVLLSTWASTYTIESAANAANQ